MAKIPTVSTYEVNETLLGGYTVSYKCPHCMTELKSKESEIGIPTECPKCGNLYGISRRASRAIELIKSEKENERQIRLAAKESKIPTCKQCGKRTSFLNRLVPVEDDLLCDECRRKSIQEAEQQRQSRLQQTKDQSAHTALGPTHVPHPVPPVVAQTFEALGIGALVLGGIAVFVAIASEHSFLEIVALLFTMVLLAVSLFGWSAIIQHTHATAHYSQIMAIRLSKPEDDKPI